MGELDSRPRWTSIRRRAAAPVRVPARAGGAEPVTGEATRLHFSAPDGTSKCYSKSSICRGESCSVPPTAPIRRAATRSIESGATARGVAWGRASTGCACARDASRPVGSSSSSRRISATCPTAFRDGRAGAPVRATSPSADVPLSPSPSGSRSSSVGVATRILVAVAAARHLFRGL